MTNTFEITNVSPAAHLGSVDVDGYINDEQSFGIAISQKDHSLNYITLDGEIVWEKGAGHPDEPIRNPINAELLNELKFLIATQIRTIRV